ncbi:MAG: hypothetical protein JNG86_23525 [Verrucomicrobiaceae bacterium]|nr:hypothetical protein [Verrucomicrobiaceae bacterium]
MKTCSTIFALLWLAAAGLCLAANPAPVKPGIVARSQYHPDNSHSESITDPYTREMTEKTYDANGSLQMRKHFLLDERGLPTQGNIYDGKNNLVARALVIYDEFGRAKEMRTANLHGEVYQQVLYSYDANGKPGKPKVMNFNVRTPTFKPSTIDFTQTVPPPAHLVNPGAPGQAVPQDGSSVVRQPPVYAPGAEPATQEQPKKKSFWKRLFGGKDK